MRMFTKEKLYNQNALRLWTNRRWPIRFKAFLKSNSITCTSCRCHQLIYSKSEACLWGINGAWVWNRSVLIGVNFCKHSWFYKIINNMDLHDFRHNRTKGTGAKVAVNIAYWFFFRNWYNISVFPRLWETAFAIRLIFNWCNGNGAKISAFSLTTQPEIPSGPVHLLEFSVSKVLKIWISQTWKFCALLSSIICWLFWS